MENKGQWRTTLNGRNPSMEDNLCWKKTLDRNQPLMENYLYLWRARLTLIENFLDGHNCHPSMLDLATPLYRQTYLLSLSLHHQLLCLSQIKLEYLPLCPDQMAFYRSTDVSALSTVTDPLGSLIHFQPPSFLWSTTSPFPTLRDPLLEPLVAEGS